jgi:hypothetical protein
MSEKITTPVGRLVWASGGNLLKGNSRNDEGKPYVYATGPNAGDAYSKYDFGLAIPKDGRDWRQTEWGSKIIAAGLAAWPGGQTGQAAFAWKVIDGDSTVLNKANKRPCDKEGYPKHWVLSFQGTRPVRLYGRAGDRWVEHPNPAAVKNGFYLQVEFTVSGNNYPKSPGVYLNHNMAAFIDEGPEIVSAFGDPNAAGFGTGPLPAGVSVTPLAPSAPLLGAGQAGPPGWPPTTTTAAPMPPTSPPANQAVTPNTSYMAAPPPAPAAPPPPPAPPGNMLPAATATYEQYKASGWTDVQLVQHGLMKDYIPF